jgi:hypothetical protein
VRRVALRFLVSAALLAAVLMYPERVSAATPLPCSRGVPVSGAAQCVQIVSADGTTSDSLASIQDTLIVASVLGCSLLAFLVGRSVTRG